MSKKIPKDLKRWLKDNGYYDQFKILINVCGYQIDALTKKHHNLDGTTSYDIETWLKYPKFTKHVDYNGKTWRYDIFLKKIGKFF